MQTNNATNTGGQVILNGSVSGGNNYSDTVYTWFQWGPTTNYDNQTPQQYLGNSGSFNQTISSLSQNTTYHFRAVAQNNYGIIYGQDMTFTTSGPGNGYYYGNGTLSVQKQVINLTSGNLNWSASVNASPSDILSFAIILQPNGQDIHNVLVRDILPANLIYIGNLMVNTNQNYSGNITSGINIGTVYGNQAIIVSYQAQVAPVANLIYGTTTLNNRATVTSTESGTQTATAAVVVNKSQVYGASDISTGLTNNLLTDSFFLPLFLIIAGLWFYFFGSVYKFANWLKTRT